MKKKMEQAKMSKAWDARLLANDRMKGLISDLEIGKGSMMKAHLKKNAEQRNI